MKIGLFSKPCSISRRLLERINLLAPGSGYHFDLSTGTGRISLDATEIFWDDQPLTGFDRIWIHGFSYANPVIPDATLQRDWSVWQIDYLTGQQEYAALFSLFEELARRGVVLFNPPRIHLDNFMKFALLEELRRTGFPIPPLLCSNDRDEVDLFCQPFPTVVWRLPTGRSAWQLFQNKQRDALIDPGKPPVLLAEGLPGSLVRAYLLNGRIVLALQCASPQHTPPLESLEHLSPVTCSDEQVAVLQRLTKEWGINWVVVTFVPSAHDLWIYDLDPDPILDWLPGIYQDSLLTLLAEGMLGLNHTPRPLLPAQERPNMFLRRMMKILFELEYSKYTRNLQKQ